MSDGDQDATTAYMHALNATYLRRAGFLARVAGNVLAVVGVIGVLAWLWLIVRQQLGNGGFFGGGFTEEGVTFFERVDTTAGTFGFLVQSVVAVAVGLAIRLFASNLLAQAGASLTGFERGDPFWSDDDPDPDLEPEPEPTDLTP